MTRTHRKTGDIASLPDYSFGPTTPGWWGVLGFVLVEGTAFVLAIGAYYYLVENESRWPPAASPPPLLWSTVFALVGVASELPNAWIKKRAEALDLRGVQLGLAVMVGIGLSMLVIRALELANLNVRWDSTAYGSIVWALLALHTFHTLTDWWDGLVLLVLTLTHPMDGRRFSDVADNSVYWHFIVWSWVALYVVVYWTPRWL